MSGLQIHAVDLAKPGQLLLDRGRWEGEQLIDKSWLEEGLRAATALGPHLSLLFRRKVGGIIGYAANGYLGQFIAVYPAERLIAVQMMGYSASYDEATDGFQNFEELVRTLRC
jgi:CubicO group peptidase (beta-lactamase class C family)